MKILVAGAAGALGRCVTAEAVRRGNHVRALVHRTSLPSGSGAPEVRRADARDATQLKGVLDGIEVVVSALGASVLPDFGKGWRSYAQVDTVANRNLIDAAHRSGVRKFAYVAVACHETLATLEYVRAHEDVVDTLRASGLEFLVIRPTGFYSAFGAMVPMALRGRIPVIGAGTAKTNPIHDADVASACLDALDGSETEIELGGPDTYTRSQLVAEAFKAVEQPVRSVTLSPTVARLMAYAMYPISPRVAQLTRFVTAVSTQDVLATPHGSRRLPNYFAEQARRLRSRGGNGVAAT